MNGLNSFLLTNGRKKVLHMKERNALTLWKMENGRPKRLNNWVYVFSTIFYFLGYIGYGAIAAVCTGQLNTEIMECIVVASLKRTTIFPVILYIIMTEVGYFLHVEGDIFQRKWYRIRRRHTMRKMIARSIPIISCDNKDACVSHTSFPAYMVVFEERVVKSGNVYTSPMLLHMHDMIEHGVLFTDPIKNMFQSDYIYAAPNVETVVAAFNAINADRSMKATLERTAAITIFEFAVVYDETPLQENKFSDNLLRLQVRKYPCGRSPYGKLIVDNKVIIATSPRYFST